MYWVKIFKIPVKSEKEAIRAVGALFEEYIDVNDLRYFVKKIKEDTYLSFAYDEQKIVNLIKKSGLILSQINNIYFAQIEFEHLFDNEELLKIDGINLSISDSLIVKVPDSIPLENVKEINIESIICSKYKIPLNFSSKYLDTKTSYTLSAILILFALFNFIKAGDFYMQNKKMNKQIEQLKEEANLPLTMIQTKSILSKLRKTQFEQKNLRDVIHFIFQFKNKINGNLISIELKENSFELKFKNTDPKKITDYFEKKYTLTSAIVKDGILTIGLKI